MGVVLGDGLDVCFLVVVHTYPGGGVLLSLNFLTQLVRVASLPSHHHYTIANFPPQSPRVDKTISPIVVQTQTHKYSTDSHTNHHHRTRTPAFLLLLFAILAANKAHQTQHYE